MHDAELPLGVDALLIAYYQSHRIATSSMYILQSYSIFRGVTQHRNLLTKAL